MPFGEWHGLPQQKCLETVLVTVTWSDITWHCLPDVHVDTIAWTGHHSHCIMPDALGMFCEVHLILIASLLICHGWRLASAICGSTPDCTA